MAWVKYSSVLKAPMDCEATALGLILASLAEVPCAETFPEAMRSAKHSTP